MMEQLRKGPVPDPALGSDPAVRALSSWDLKTLGEGSCKTPLGSLLILKQQSQDTFPAYSFFYPLIHIAVGIPYSFKHFPLADNHNTE